MNCESAPKKIRSFFEDMLEEEEYQEVHRHLLACGHCRDYAGSIGSFSYRLHALGEAALPPDIVSAVLYTLKEIPAPTDVSRPDGRSQGPFWAVTSVVVLASFGVVTYFFMQHRASRDPEPVMAAATATLVPATVSSEGDAPVRSSTHWHYHISESGQEEVLGIIREMKLIIVQQSPQLFIFDVPKTQLAGFQERLGAVSGVVKEFGDRDVRDVAEDPIQVSVYLD